MGSQKRPSFWKHPILTNLVGHAQKNRLQFIASSHSKIQRGASCTVVLVCLPLWPLLLKRLYPTHAPFAHTCVYVCASTYSVVQAVAPHKRIGYEPLISVMRCNMEFLQMGGCQNYGPFLGPCYNTAPNI